MNSRNVVRKALDEMKERGELLPLIPPSSGPLRDQWDSEQKATRQRLIKELETNSTVDRKLRRENLSCPHCRPNRGENAKRRPKHGKTKPKSKTRKRA